MRQCSKLRPQAQVGQPALDQRHLAVGAVVRLGVGQRHVADGVLGQPVGVGQLVQVALVEDRVAAGVQLAQPAAGHREVRAHLGALPVAERERDLHAALVGQQPQVLAHRVEVGGLGHRVGGRLVDVARGRGDCHTISASSSTTIGVTGRRRRPASAQASSGPATSSAQAGGVAAHRGRHDHGQRRAQRVQHGAHAQRRARCAAAPAAPPRRTAGSSCTTVNGNGA